MTDKKIADTEETTEILDAEEPSTLVPSKGTDFSLPADMEGFLEEAASTEDQVERVPMMIIDQKDGSGNMGKLFCEKMQAHWESGTFSVLKRLKSRLLWPEDYNQENDPLCRSYDAITPADDIEGATKMADSCELLPGSKKHHHCPYADWTSGKPPRCQERINLLLWHWEVQTPMWYTVYSIGLSPTKSHLVEPLILRLAPLTSRLQGMADNRGLTTAHPSMFSVKLTTVLKKGPKGDAYAPVWSDLKELPMDKKMEAVMFAHQLQHQDLKFEMEAENAEAPEKDKF